MSEARHRTYLLTGTLLTGVLLAFFLTVLSGGAKAQAQVVATGDPVLAAAGDIAQCTSPYDEYTAALLGTVPVATVVAALGDNAYESGTTVEYQNCYGPSWGLYKVQTMPSLGNHEYKTAGASGYFDYFSGLSATPSAPVPNTAQNPGLTPGKGYYSYDLGSWHIVVLNSNCAEAGGCGRTSEQVKWLKADLAAHSTTTTTACTLAYWHAPRFSSKQTGTPFGPFWNALYRWGTEVVLNGHVHNYERFAEQKPSGEAAPGRGIREFVVGTGGANLMSFTTIRANSEVRDASTFGVLKLTLHPSSYDWQFVPVAGQSFTDSGTTSCH